MQLGSTRSDFECERRTCSVLGVPWPPFPLAESTTRDHSSLASRPSRVFHRLPAVRCVSLGRTPLRSPGPFNDVTRASPVMERVVQPPPRFRSQVSSTSQRFPGRLELRGLVSCRNRSWDPSLQSLPPAGIAHLSRGRWLPCSHPPPCGPRRPRSCRRRFRRRPRSRAVAGVPRRLWAPFQRAEARLPVPLDPTRRARPVAVSFTCFEAFFPLRIRSRRPGSPLPDGRCSPGLPAPPEPSPPTPRIL